MGEGGETGGGGEVEAKAEAEAEAESGREGASRRGEGGSRSWPEKLQRGSESLASNGGEEGLGRAD